MERLEAVHEPLVSNCVAAGSRYTARLGFRSSALPGMAAMAAVAEGYGSTTTSRSSLSMARFISRPRVCELGAWPQKNTPRRLESWSISSFFSSTPSIQRDTVMPLLVIIAGDAYCFLIHSKSTPQTAAKCFHEPSARP
ncbi:hypothetical protein D3C71_1589790 [compost metagenome]